MGENKRKVVEHLQAFYGECCNRRCYYNTWLVFVPVSTVMATASMLKASSFP